MSHDRLSTLDASFLDAEQDRMPLHIGALCRFDGEPFYDEAGQFRLEAVRRRVAERLHLFPRFRQRIHNVPLGLDRPVWVDDPDFDVADHVHLAVLPPPGDRAQLEARCEQLQMRRLPRDQPLWELWFIGGLQDGTVAMVEKVHHAMIDGVSGVEVAAALFDAEPDPPPIEVPPFRPEPGPDDLGLALEGLGHLVSEPVAALRLGLDVLRGPARAVGQAAELARASASALLPGAWSSSTSLGQRVGPRRRLVSTSAPLDEIKEAAHRVDAKVNDVVLAAVSGALRRLLERRDEHPDDLHLRVLVPVSVRTDDEHLALGNQVASILAPLAVEQPTPARRLATTRDTMATLKAHHQAESTGTLLEAADHLPPGITGLLARNLHRQPFVNVVVTNIPGPPFPLWFMGARMLESVPIVPLNGNLTVSIAVLSYDGDLILGIHTDADACPEADALAAWVHQELDALLALDPDEVPARREDAA